MLRPLSTFLFLLSFSQRPHAIELLGGDPLSNGPPPFPATDHPQSPSLFWGQVPKPYPTNSWWENLVLGQGTNLIMTMPFEVKALDDGVHVSLPGKVVESNYVLSTFVDNMHFSAQESLGAREVTKHDPLSVTMRWKNGFEVPLVRGMPYVTIFYENLTPVLNTIHAILSINGNPVGGAVSGTRFAVEMNNSQTWIIYTSSEITLTPSGGSLVASAPFSGTLRAGVALSQGDADVLDAHADRIPTGGTVEASSTGDVGEYRFNWQATGSGTLMMMALPHQMDSLSGATTTSLKYNTIKGDVTGISGDQWVMKEDLTTVSWNAINPINPAKLGDIQNALIEDLSSEVVAGDPYFGGKQMAKLARLALMAEEVGDDGLAEQYRQKLKPVLQGWLDGTNDNPLLYDQSWGGIVSTDGLSDPTADFGQGYYNDHHFHYGYHIYAAAVLAKADPNWADENDEKVIALIRDIAEPSGQDPYFTFVRNKDWYAGHAWANGIAADFADSHNQESTSESVNGYYAVYLYGLATNNERIKDLGRLMLAHEIRGAQKYWQITSASNIYEEPFASNKVVGILWSTKVDYATWFGANVEFIHCIQMLPFVPITEELLPKEWIQEEYPVLSSAMNSASEEWKGYIIMAHGIIDPEAAWSEAQTLENFDDGNSKSNTLYWLATRP